MEITLNKIFIAICLGAVFILLNNLRLVQYEVEQLKRLQNLKKISYVLDLKQVLPKHQFNVTNWYKEMLQQVNKPKKKSLKIYIYDLPRKFNRDIISCVYPKLTPSNSHNGMGPEINREQQLSMHVTPKHSLEWLIHEKLLFSHFRTRVAAQANLYYIPAYLGLAFLCKDKMDVMALTEELFAVLKNISSFQDGKPHLSTLIETDPSQTLINCTLFKHSTDHKVTYISTSKKQLLGWDHDKQKVILAPYSSSAHLLAEYSLNENNLLKTNSLEQRAIQVFMADTEWPTSLLHSKITEQFKLKSNQSFEKFTKNNKIERLQAIMLSVPESREGLLRKWMQHSVFCVQPSGYSSPRKLFYDAIMCGCIPVMLQDNFTTDYPFQSRLNYSSFTYTISNYLINDNQTIIQILESVSENIRQSLLKNVGKVAHWLQYSLPDNNTHAIQYDALTLIADELRKMFD